MGGPRRRFDGSAPSTRHPARDDRGADPRGGRAARRDRGSGSRPAPRADRPVPGRPARRSDARHLGVLPDAGPYHPRADHEARLHDRRGRSRLAGCRAGRSLRSPRAGGAGGGARLQPLPDLDVEKRRGPRVRRVAPILERGLPRPRAPGRLLRPRSLQPLHLDRRGPPLPGRGGPGYRRARPPALRLPESLGAGPRGLWPRRPHGAVPDLRGAGHPHAPRHDGAPPRVHRP